MTLRAHWTLLGVVTAAVPVALEFLAPRLTSGLPLSLSDAVLVSVSLLVVGLLLRSARRPGMHAVGSVLLGIGSVLLALAVGQVAFLLWVIGHGGL
jgi:hypothetical protein